MQELLCKAGTRLTFDASKWTGNGIERGSRECKTNRTVMPSLRWIVRAGWLETCLQWSHSIAFTIKGPGYLPMMDGSMILTRQKDESWKEVKLCRTFRSVDRVEDISKDRNHIGHSDYVAHLGKHTDFFDKVIEIIPTQSHMVFICDGAKWIWKWIDE